MKRLSVFALILAALVLACNVPGPVTSVPATQQPPQPTDTAQLPATPEPAETQAPLTNVQCSQLAFFLDPAVAASYTCETIPEDTQNDPFQMPQHTRVTLTGYALPDQPLFQRIHVYRLAEFLALRPQAAAGIDTLKGLIAGAAPGANALPVPDLFGAAQEFHAQYQVVAFANGGGIRFVSQYAQFCSPINNHDMFLVFQGLTADEQFYISAVLRISNPILPGTYETLPAGMSADQPCDGFDPYILNITNQLNAQPEASFTPGIPLLDALIQSITITP
jgi:hypothetical protein